MISMEFLKSRQQWKQCGIAFIVGMLGMKVVEKNIHFVVNSTDSLPYKAFLHLPNKLPQKGDYTLIDSIWYDAKLIKQVVGVAGDEIAYTPQGELKIGNQVVGTPKSQSRDGRPLTPLKPQIIPTGKVFLYAPHSSSFDSRYEELGLAPIEALQGTAYPLDRGS
ncbi:S26 family signal peptidase [Candidatus Odyssella thessalonicensis]|uniref:S26 family signal peptidase n=1 Tax=Candidatus Odyssella thessalonicensis TaxID=84647 RepID=UPI000225ACE4|nr:S26 family signal peptidase [Candidatus Odyssella thessalonicensis]